MIILDKALEERARSGNPIRVAVMGAGVMGSGIIFQILNSTPGIHLAGVYDHNREHAERSLIRAGMDTIVEISSRKDVEENTRNENTVIVPDPSVLLEADNIDAVVEATGDVEFGTNIALRAIEQGKHIIQMNAELGALLGPILKYKADKAGVIYTDSDGDQPGVIMNLYRYVKAIGFKPVLAGNIKGLQDPYRTPETQKGYAEQYGLKPEMATSFADGTKISMEMALVANATELRVGKRGMYGPECDHVDNAPDHFPADQMMETGLVDYLLGARPAPGVFIIGFQDHPVQRHYLNYYKMGEGPFYVFYTPYHLCHFEVPLTVARAVLFKDASVAPLGGPVCEVITTAKRDLVAGELLDGIGGFTCYGVLENHEIVSAENLLPMSQSSGAVLKKAAKKDHAITYADVNLPAGRICDSLKLKQNSLFKT